ESSPRSVPGISSASSPGSGWSCFGGVMSGKRVTGSVKVSWSAMMSLLGDERSGPGSRVGVSGYGHGGRRRGRGDEYHVDAAVVLALEEVVTRGRLVQRQP